MNRLQKKCLIATAGLHLSLVLILVFGAAFFTERSKPDETQLLDVISPILIDEAFNSGVKGAQPPPPTPPQPPQPVQQPQPQPPQPKPEPVKQPDPEPVKPAPTLMQKVEKFFKPTEKLPPDDLKPVETADKPTKPTSKKIEVNLKPVVRNTTKPTPDTTAADEARETKRQRDARLKAIAKAAASIKENASSATTIEMKGESSVSYANYASAVKSIYDRAWKEPSDMTSDDVTTKVSVTISRDGRVISSRIIERSGDSRVDASVQRVLDRVDFIGPFPDGATEKERTFIINFNPQAKRMNG